MPSLTVPVPILKYEATASGLATIENAIQVLCTSPTLPDGSLFRQEDMGVAGFLVYRMWAAGALWEVWDSGTRQWETSTSNEAILKKEPLTYKEGDPSPWQGILVAAGQQDKNGQDQFTATVPPSPFPQYMVRAFFSANRGGQILSGLSAGTPTVRFVKMVDAMRVGLGIPDGQTPMTAEEFKIFLRNSALSIIGLIDVKVDGASSHIMITNLNDTGMTLAQVQLNSAGEIRLQPAPGQKVVITGPLEAEQITYQPSVGGGRVTL
jgi:hypothetical protein